MVDYYNRLFGEILLESPEGVFDGPRSISVVFVNGNVVPDSVSIELYDQIETESLTCKLNKTE